MKLRKKVLMLIPLPPPHYGSAMSSEMCLNILKEDKGIEVRHVKLNFAKEMKDVGRLSISKVKGVFRVSEKIKSELRSFKPDLIYVVPATSGYGLIRDSYFVNQVAKNSSSPIILHIRSRVLEKDWKNPLFKKILRKMFSGKRIIILGETLISDLHETVSEKMIDVLPNAIENEVDNRLFKKIVKKRGLNKRLELLFLSNMDRTKGWFKVLQACAILDKKNVNFRCSFVGEWKEGDDESDFFRFVKENNLSGKIDYLGKLTGEQKNEVLEKSHILVFPTEYQFETFGRVIIEAMMYGMPVIANSIATIPSIIENDKTGLVLSENTPKEIVEAILKLKEEKVREKMGMLGRKRFLNKFELKRYRKEFVKVILGAIDRG